MKTTSLAIIFVIQLTIFQGCTNQVANIGIDANIPMEITQTITSIRTSTKREVSNRIATIPTQARNAEIFGFIGSHQQISYDNIELISQIGTISIDDEIRDILWSDNSEIIVIVTARNAIVLGDNFSTEKGTIEFDGPLRGKLLLSRDGRIVDIPKDQKVKNGQSVTGITIREKTYDEEWNLSPNSDYYFRRDVFEDIEIIAIDAAIKGGWISYNDLAQWAIPSPDGKVLTLFSGFTEFNHDGISNYLRLYDVYKRKLGRKISFYNASFEINSLIAYYEPTTSMFALFETPSDDQERTSSLIEWDYLNGRIKSSQELPSYSMVMSVFDKAGLIYIESIDGVYLARIQSCIGQDRKLLPGSMKWDQYYASPDNRYLYKINGHKEILVYGVEASQNVVEATAVNGAINCPKPYLIQR